MNPDIYLVKCAAWSYKLEKEIERTAVSTNSYEEAEKRAEQKIHETRHAEDYIQTVEKKYLEESTWREVENQ